MSIHQMQHDALLQPPNQKAVHTRSQGGKTFTYLAQHAVRADLIRVFGFDGWLGEVEEAELVSQREVPARNDGTQWEVCWRVRYRLTVRFERAPDDFESPVASTWVEDAVGSATGPHLADVLDQALKSASSDAMKRCAMNLGSRFGLGLYFDGYQGDVVRETIPQQMAAAQAQANGDGVPPPAGPDPSPSGRELLQGALSGSADPSSTEEAPPVGAVPDTVEALASAPAPDDPGDASPDDAVVTEEMF